MGRRHPYRRSDLFLVRLWAEEVDGANETKESADAADSGRDSEYPANSGNLQWHGKVQRVVDGESHRFSDWQGLCDLLLAMLSKTGRAPALDDSSK